MNYTKHLAVALTLMFLFATVDSIRSDDATEGKKVAETKKAADKKKPALRLPNLYASLKLSEEQRKQVYGIQEKYQAEFAALRKKLAELRRKREAEIQTILTDEQKEALKSLKKLTPPNKRKGQKNSGNTSAKK